MMDRNLNCEISFEGEEWGKELPGLETLTREIVLECLNSIPVIGKLAKDSVIEVSFVFSSDPKIKIMNKEYRGKDKPTNVLSFPSETKESLIRLTTSSPFPEVVLLGDIILGYETVHREARVQKKDFGHHITHLVVHGVLHLLGYDHVLDNEAEEMESLEILVLEKLGVQNPYRGQEA